MLGTYADVGRATQYAQDSPQLKWLRHGEASSPGLTCLSAGALFFDPNPYICSGSCNADGFLLPAACPLKPDQTGFLVRCCSTACMAGPCVQLAGA